MLHESVVVSISQEEQPEVTSFTCKALQAKLAQMRLSPSGREGNKQGWFAVDSA